MRESADAVIKSIVKLALRYNTAVNVTLELADGKIRRTLVLNNAWCAPIMDTLHEGDKVSYEGWILDAETIDLSVLVKQTYTGL